MKLMNNNDTNNIDFVKLTLKNFLSVGGEPLEILFNEVNNDRTTINLVPDIRYVRSILSSIRQAIYERINAAIS